MNINGWKPGKSEGEEFQLLRFAQPSKSRLANVSSSEVSRLSLLRPEEQESIMSYRALQGSKGLLVVEPEPPIENQARPQANSAGTSAGTQGMCPGNLLHRQVANWCRQLVC